MFVYPCEADGLAPVQQIDGFLKLHMRSFPTPLDYRCFAFGFQGTQTAVLTSRSRAEALGIPGVARPHDSSHRVPRAF